MSLDTVRASLVDLVEGVQGISGVAPVFDYYRHVTTIAEVKSILVGANQDRLHFWSVTPASAEPMQVIEPCDALYRFDIRGIYAVEDASASEKAFVTIVQRVIAAWRADKNLGDTARRYGNPALTWSEFDARMVVSTLCHHARLTVAYKQAF